MKTTSSRHWRANLLVPALLAAFACQAGAVTFTATQSGPTTWKYDITFSPWDNYSLTQTNTTITLTGLSGVTAAAGPTSTDFPGSLDATNLAWTAQVLNGGTKVVWTHVGPGTGNFPTAMHIYGFSVTAPAAQSGTVSYSTSGFVQDVSNGGANLDISGSIAGPTGVAVAPTSVPAGSPLTLALISIALACAGGYFVRYRLDQGRA